MIDESGNAVGILVRLSPGLDGSTTDATDLAFHLDQAEQVTGIDFELQTAPFE